MHRRRGFTLLEVLLTVLLMTGGFVALLQIVSMGIFGGTENETELIAVNLAQEKIADIQNTGYAGIVNETKGAVSGFPAFTREVVVTTPQANLKQVTVNVYWFSKSKEANTTLVTYVSNT